VHQLLLHRARQLTKYACVHERMDGWMGSVSRSSHTPLLIDTHPTTTTTTTTTTTNHPPTNQPTNQQTHLQERLPVPRGHRQAIRLPNAAPRLQPLLHRDGRAPLLLLLLLLLVVVVVGG
jgi:hypothetical protein